MDNKTYKRQKLEYAYNLYKNRKFFKKARAIVVDEKNVLLLEVTYLNGIAHDLHPNPNRKLVGKHYLLPGGGVDDGETIKQAVVREAYEEYGVNVKPVKYLGKQHYKVPMNIDGTDFVSNRVEYYYLCSLKNDEISNQFGLESEFEEKGKVYKKVKLNLDEIKKLDAADINEMSEKAYQQLVEFLQK